MDIYGVAIYDMVFDIAELDSEWSVMKRHSNHWGCLSIYSPWTEISALLQICLFA